MAEEAIRPPEHDVVPPFEELLTLLQQRMAAGIAIEGRYVVQSVQGITAEVDEEVDFDASESTLEDSVARHPSGSRKLYQPNGAFVRYDNPYQRGDKGGFHSILMKVPEENPPSDGSARLIHPGDLLQVKVFRPYQPRKEGEERRLPTEEEIFATKLFVLQFTTKAADRGDAFYVVSDTLVTPLDVATPTGNQNDTDLIKAIDEALDDLAVQMLDAAAGPEPDSVEAEFEAMKRELEARDNPDVIVLDTSANNDRDIFRLPSQEDRRRQTELIRGWIDNVFANMNIAAFES